MNELRTNVGPIFSFEPSISHDFGDLHPRQPDSPLQLASLAAVASGPACKRERESEPDCNAVDNKRHVRPALRAGSEASGIDDGLAEFWDTLEPCASIDDDAPAPVQADQQPVAQQPSAPSPTQSIARWDVLDTAELTKKIRTLFKSESDRQELFLLLLANPGSVGLEQLPDWTESRANQAASNLCEARRLGYGAVHRPQRPSDPRRLDYSLDDDLRAAVSKVELSAVLPKPRVKIKRAPLLNQETFEEALAKADSNYGFILGQLVARPEGLRKATWNHKDMSWPDVHSAVSYLRKMFGEDLIPKTFEGDRVHRLNRNLTPWLAPIPAAASVPE